ncbi:MAG: enoyl-CoA hydratase-related protein [Beijerinckiaceae bacterium]
MAAAPVLPRIEDESLLRGTGRFIDDLPLPPGCLHASILRSPVAHAGIAGIDVSRALALPGVVAVVTGADIQRYTRPFVVGVKQPMEHWSLAVDRVRIIVLRAEGEHFSSGGNIKGFMEASPETVSKLAWNIAAPQRCSKPVIAANRGYCFGVGFEISLACDFRIVSETCQYALPEQRLGQIPGSGGSARLQMMVGVTRPKDIVMRSRRIPGKQAFDWGVATECVPDGDLEKATDVLVDELRSFSPLAQRTAKKLLNDTEDTSLSIAIEMEGHCYSRLRTSEDFREGVEAFHAKRPARFTGR